jgi:hypothetical protein
VLITAAFAYAPRKNRTAVQVAAAVAMLRDPGRAIVVLRSHITSPASSVFSREERSN